MSTTRLSALQWGISVFLGAVSILAGVIIRLIPNSVFIRLHSLIRLEGGLSDNSRDAQFIWNTVFESVQSEFATLNELSRSVLHRLKYNLQHAPEFFLSIFSNRTTTSRSAPEGGEVTSDDEERPLLRANGSTRSYLKASPIPTLSIQS